MKHALQAAAAALFALVGAATAIPACAETAAQPGVKVGMLQCESDAGWGYIVGSSRAVDCTYTPAQGAAEHYKGSLGKLGLDVGYKGPGVMLWTVVAPTSAMSPGVLAGSYGGVTAGAAAGVGLSANAMIGGSDRHVALQPVSVEGDVGLNVSAGLGGLTLTYVGS